MKRLISMVWVLASAFALCLTSCLNEASDPNSNEGLLPSNVAELASQVEAMKATVNEVESVVNELSGNDELQDEAAELEACATAVKEHIAAVEAGLSGVKAVVAAMNLQGQIAKATGAVTAQIELLSEDLQSAKFSSAVASLESGVAAWLGKDFKNYFVVSAEQARLESLHAVVKEQSISTDAIASDVEAGLRVGDATGLNELVATVAKSSETLLQLNQKMTALCSEVEQGYTKAFKSSSSNTKSTLKALNTKATAAVAESVTAINDLVARISACEVAIKDLNARLQVVETNVGKLLDMIQSLTFMSDFASDYATAYYEMDLDSKVSDPSKSYNGKCVRTPVNTIELNYMVRPAAAASAVSKEVVSVMGYYATKLQTKAVDPSMFFDFDVESVSVTNPERGVVTVRVNHNLDEAFYFKEKGAKCALSIKAGQTDITSKFVELTPVDNSGKVYVQSVVPSKDVVEIKKGETMTLEATVNPSNAANKAVYWASTDTRIVRIDETTGNLLAYGVGTADVQVISRGTDEWGLPVVGTCKVVVTEAVTLTGPAYVEVGKTADLTLDFPGEMLVESKVWWTSEEKKATVADGTVTGVADTYLPYNYDYGTITVYCMINGNITVSHDMKVVVPQPRQIVFNDYDDDEHVISMKLDQSISLAGTIHPAESADKFRLFYESNAGSLGWINSGTGVINENSSNLSPGTYYVYARVFEIDKNHYYAPGNSLWREMIVNVEPYYVKSISFADVELEPGANVTLVPTFTSDVSGKQPTTTKLTWESSNSQIATVDENGLVNALGEGDVTITATATDGSGVKGTCKVTITAPWKEFEIGDYVVRKSNGEIEFFTSSTDAKNNGTVVGVVIYKGNPRVSDTKLPADCTHGIAIGLGEGIGKWWSSSQNAEPYNLTGYVNSSYNTAGYVLPGGVQGSFTNPTLSDLGKKPYGYNNTMLFKEFLALKTGTSSDIITKLNEYNADNNKRTPTGASSWYLPSIYEMYAVYTANNLLNGSLNTILQGVGGTTLTNNSSWPYWTVSEHADSPSSYAAAINPITGAVYGKFKTTTSTYVRFVFAF